MKHKHEQSIRAIDALALKALWDYLLIPVDAHTPELDKPCQEIDGLPVYDGLQCSMCAACFVKPDSIKKHFRERHLGSVPPSTFTVVSVQHFDEGIHRSYFPVIPVDHPKSSFEDFMRAVGRCYPPLEPSSATDATVDARTLSPWLRQTRWHELIGESKIEDLRALVAMPKPLEFPGLHEGIARFYSDASELIDQTSTLILQKLHSPMPTIEYVRVFDSVIYTHCFFTELSTPHSIIYRIMNKASRATFCLS